MMRFAPLVHPPDWITRWFPEAVWRMENDQKVVYLTFDDGPVPEATPWVLELLNQQDCKATFFCVGQNVERYPLLYRQILDNGHSVGNHTFNHIKGIHTPVADYLANIQKAQELINSNLFRPPHGIMKLKQYKAVSQRYRIIMWDIVSHDYQARLTPKEIVENVLTFAKSGSIITFHDSVKAKANLVQSLPLVIKSLKKRGFRFLPLPYHKINDVHLPPELVRYNQKVTA